MITLVITPNGNQPAIKALKDFTQEDMDGFMCRAMTERSTNSFGTRKYDLATPIWITACSQARKSDPVTFRFEHNNQIYQYRGPIIVCGCDESGAPANLPSHYIAEVQRDGTALEPGYRDDAIFLPSIAEWDLIPQAIRESILGAMWGWTRTCPGAACANTVRHSTSKSWPCGAEKVLNPNGAVPALINLQQLPDDVQEIIRARPISDTERDSNGNVLYHAVTFTKSHGAKFGANLHLIRVSDNVYGINAYDIDLFFPSCLAPFDNHEYNPACDYEHCSLRAQLASIVPKLCIFIQDSI